MRIVIHDLNEEVWKQFANVSSDVKVISDNGTIKRCVGCFGCWVKTPGQCVIPDDYQKLGEWFGQADEMIVISHCSFGGYSSFVKNVMERSISYMLPYFEMRGGEMHHKARYENHIRMKVYFYGDDITDSEKEVARKLVQANGVNFQGEVKDVVFVTKPEELREVIAW